MGLHPPFQLRIPSRPPMQSQSRFLYTSMTPRRTPEIPCPERGGARTPPFRALRPPRPAARLGSRTSGLQPATGGDYVPAFHSQVRQSPPPNSPGRCFAHRGPRRDPRQRPCPGPVPAPGHRRPQPGQPRPADGGAQEGGRLRGPPRLQPPHRGPLLLHPPPGHRRLDHPTPTGSGAAGSSSPRAGSTPSSTRPWTSSPSSTPNSPSCWSWPSRELAAATTTSSTP